MNNVQQLYQKIILEHANHPNGFGVLESYTHQVELRNVECGDSFQVFALVEERQIKKISFVGEGCIISKASASMMVDSIHGTKIENIQKQVENFQNMILNKPFDENSLGDLVAFKSLNQFPTRVRCGMLPWHALIQILEEINE